MLQRIQTLFLVIAATITSLLFFFDMALLANETGLFRLTFNGVYSINAANEHVIPAYALIILLIINVLLLVTIVILYKKRILQVRLCGMALGLLVGLSGMIFYFGKTASNELGAELTYTWALVLPLVAMVLVFLSIRAIGKDEALVRALDRIR